MHGPTVLQTITASPSGLRPRTGLPRFPCPLLLSGRRRCLQASHIMFNPEHPLSPPANPASTSSISSPARRFRLRPRPLHTRSPSSSPPGRTHSVTIDRLVCGSNFACSPAVSGEPVSTTTWIACVPLAPSTTVVFAEGTRRRLRQPQASEVERVAEVIH